MNTAEFICAAFGCSKAECEFLDTLVDEQFPSFGDWDDDLLDDFDRKYGLLVNYLIGVTYDEIINYYVEKGLDESKFEVIVNSICSSLSYDGEYVNEQDLEQILEQQNTDEENDEE